MTGQPVWPIVERPVPRGKVPTEWYSPTQPYPTKPAAYDMQGIRESDVNDWTPEIKAEALRVLNLHKYSDNVFEPPIDRGQDGKFGMLMMPGNNGGTNWEGGAFDPETEDRLHLLVDRVQPAIAHQRSRAFEHELHRRWRRRAVAAVRGAPKRAAARRVAAGAAAGSRGRGRRGRAGGAADGAPPLNAFGLPLIKPPYGRVTAINMNTGDHVWMQPIGGTPENIKNHKMLQGVDDSATPAVPAGRASC